jgi:hypothetical protein
LWHSPLFHLTVMSDDDPELFVEACMLMNLRGELAFLSPRTHLPLMHTHNVHTHTCTHFAYTCTGPSCVCLQCFFARTIPSSPFFTSISHSLPCTRSCKVRGVLLCDLGVVTASRDKSIKIWVQEGSQTEGPAYNCVATLVSLNSEG